MILKISGLGQGIHHLNYSGDAKDLKIDELFVDRFNLDLQIDRSIAQVLVTAGLSLSGKFNCDRCGQEFIKPVDTLFKVAFHFTRPGEKPLEDDDFKMISFDADKIDISQEIRDYSSLAIPLKNLCSEECKGLCPRCGKNLNSETCTCRENEINSIWSPLAELKEKFNNNK